MDKFSKAALEVNAIQYISDLFQLVLTDSSLISGVFLSFDSTRWLQEEKYNIFLVIIFDLPIKIQPNYL